MVFDNSNKKIHLLGGFPLITLIHNYAFAQSIS